MTSKEAYSILHNGLVNAPSEHDWCMAFDMAVKSLKAWEKVIERLTEMANDKWNEQVGSSKGLNDAIEVIEDILSEVENEQTER